MARYESTIIITPVLSDEEVKNKLKSYRDFLEKNGATNVTDEHWGLKKMAYAIEKKSSGVYHIFDYTAPGDVIEKLELQFKRDESILRFLTVKLDKYGVEYADKRKAGKVGKLKTKKDNQPKEEVTNG
jgi:small subunit ribosomal protein S6